MNCGDIWKLELLKCRAWVLHYILFFLPKGDLNSRTHVPNRLTNCWRTNGLYPHKLCTDHVANGLSIIIQQYLKFQTRRACLRQIQCGEAGNICLFLCLFEKCNALSLGPLTMGTLRGPFEIVPNCVPVMQPLRVTWTTVVFRYHQLQVVRCIFYRSYW